MTEEINPAADFVKMLKDETGLSYADISRRAGFYPRFAGRVVSGEIGNPSISALRKLANACGYEIIIDCR